MDIKDFTSEKKQQGYKYNYPERINFDSPAHRAGVIPTTKTVLKGLINNILKLLLMNPFRILNFILYFPARCAGLSKTVLSGQIQIKSIVPKVTRKQKIYDLDTIISKVVTGKMNLKSNNE